MTAPATHVLCVPCPAPRVHESPGRHQTHRGRAGPYCPDHGLGCPLGWVALLAMLTGRLARVRGTPAVRPCLTCLAAARRRWPAANRSSTSRRCIWWAALDLRAVRSRRPGLGGLGSWTTNVAQTGRGHIGPAPTGGCGFRSTSRPSRWPSGSCGRSRRLIDEYRRVLRGPSVASQGAAGDPRRQRGRGARCAEIVDQPRSRWRCVAATRRRRHYCALARA
ncbi:hypothetical protein MAUB1S_04204 [Mycolicibacterium aubagnense]